MSQTMSVEEYRARMQAIERSEAAKGLKAHAVVTAAVNVVLFTVNMLFVPEVWWFVFPLIGTTIGLVAHYLGSTFLLSREMERRERLIESMAR